jgi:hypothetical protein
VVGVITRTGKSPLRNFIIFVTYDALFCPRMSSVYAVMVLESREATRPTISSSENETSAATTLSLGEE